MARAIPELSLMRDVESKPVQWLWPGVIPQGKLTLIAGDPGLGKSMLATDMAARASRGGPWPGPEPRGPVAKSAEREMPGGGGARVALLSAEDDPADTIRPRLDAAGADVSRILLMHGVLYDTGRSVEFSIDKHAGALRELLECSPELRLLVIDPISAYLGDVDSHNNTQVRAALRPLAALAQHYRIAIVAITHLRKGAGERAVYRAMGSLAFTAAARMVLLVARDPSDFDGRLVLPVKSNLGADRFGLRYWIRDGRLVWDEARAEWTADEVIDARCEPPADDAADPTLIAQASHWLLEALEPGPMPAAIVESAAKARGFSPGTLRRAKAELGVRSVREGDAWHWTLERVNTAAALAPATPTAETAGVS